MCVCVYVYVCVCILFCIHSVILRLDWVIYSIYIQCGFDWYVLIAILLIVLELVL